MVWLVRGRNGVGKSTFVKTWHAVLSEVCPDLFVFRTSFATFLRDVVQADYPDEDVYSDAFKKKQVWKEGKMMTGRQVLQMTSEYLKQKYNDPALFAHVVLGSLKAQRQRLSPETSMVALIDDWRFKVELDVISRSFPTQLVHIVSEHHGHKGVHESDVDLDGKTFPGELILERREDDSTMSLIERHQTLLFERLEKEGVN